MQPQYELRQYLPMEQPLRSGLDTPTWTEQQSQASAQTAGLVLRPQSAGADLEPSGGGVTLHPGKHCPCCHTEFQFQPRLGAFRQPALLEGAEVQSWQGWRLPSSAVGLSGCLLPQHSLSATTQGKKLQIRALALLHLGWKVIDLLIWT